VAVGVDLLRPEVLHDLHRPLPKMSFWKMSVREACGSTEKTRTFFPCEASQ